MTSLQLKSSASLIWDKLFSIHNHDKTKEEQQAIIEKELIKLAYEQRKVGRNQVINHIGVELESLK